MAQPRRGRLLLGARHVALVVATSGLARAAPPVPAGLEPGDEYHLVFNSSFLTSGVSADISTYNRLAQDAANSAGIGDSEGVSWYAVASTAQVDARDNAVIGATTPVYNMIGERVAAGFADMWDWTIDASLAWDQFGHPNTIDAWTGSLPYGTGDAGFTLGNTASFLAWCGSPASADGTWTSVLRPNLSAFLSVYALSETLTAPFSADFDRSGVVDGNDLVRWQQGFGATPAGLGDGDANGDDVVAADDLAIWEAQFSVRVDGSLPAATPVPEPSTLVPALAASWAIVLWRSSSRRRSHDAVVPPCLERTLAEIAPAVTRTLS